MSALDVLVKELEQAYENFEKKLHDYHLTKSEEILKESASHSAIARIVEKTKAHPFYHERYVKDLEAFDEIDAITPATKQEIERVVQNHVVVETGVGEPKSTFKNIVKDGGIEPVLALDCEMVGTSSDKMALARLSAVNVQGEMVIDVLVLPCHHSYIEDCRTHITGIHLHDLKQKGVDINTARRIFASKANSETLLIGHALEHDIMALQLKHSVVIDTALLYPVLEADTGKVNQQLSHGLDYLSTVILKRDMDRDKRQGIHDSVEDSRNSLDLAKHLVALESRETKISPIPQRVRPRKRGRGSGYGVAATLRALSDYSLKQSFSGAGEASSVTGRKLNAKLTKKQFVNSNNSNADLINRVKQLAKKQKTTSISINQQRRTEAIKMSSSILSSSRRFTQGEKARKKMSKLKSMAKSFSTFRKRK